MHIDDEGIPQLTPDRGTIARAMCADAGEVWAELTEAGRERWLREADAQIVTLNAALALQFAEGGAHLLSTEEILRRLDEG